MLLTKVINSEFKERLELLVELGKPTSEIAEVISQYPEVQKLGLGRLSFFSHIDSHIN